MYIRSANHLLSSALVFILVAAAFVSPVAAITPDDPGPGDVLLTIDAGQNVKPISPYIYGMNFFAGSSLTNPVTIDRLGGNRWTGYNWETNASNAGSDFYHHSDSFLGSGPPGNAVLGSLQAAAANNRALIVTVPMAGYVSADTNGTVDETEIAPSSRWHEVVPKKNTIYPGDPLSLAPDENDNYVFTDEYVNWVEQTREPDQTVFYSLDNEPALWGDELPPGWQSGVVPNPCCDPANGVDPDDEGRTHPTIHPFAPTFAEMRDKTIAHAGAIKDVNPNALVIGGVGYGWLEAVNLQTAPDRETQPSHPDGDQGGELHYYEWLLDALAEEEAAQGRTLVDVIDLHWYPEARGLDNGGESRRIVFDPNPLDPGVVAARLQAPRSLWDETYVEQSWITDCCSGGPIKLLKHLHRDIDDFKPGTKIAITEYNYGGTNHISGGIAQADALGVFADEEVFAATFWSLQGDNQSQFASGAFKMYLDYDGQGGTFGDFIVDASTDDLDASSIYASLDSENPNQMVVVAINRNADPLDAAIALTSDRQFTSAEVYQLTSGNPNPEYAGDFPIDLLNAFHYTMPGYSVSTLVLTSPGYSADFDGDGDVDSEDLTHPTLGWEARYGIDLDGDDFLAWQQQFGSGVGPHSSSTAVPEPTCLMLMLSILPLMIALRRNLW